MSAIDYLWVLVKEHEQERNDIIERLKTEVNIPNVVKRNGELWSLAGHAWRVTSRKDGNIELVSLFVNIVSIDISKDDLEREGHKVKA